MKTIDKLMNMIADKYSLSNILLVHSKSFSKSEYYDYFRSSLMLLDSDLKIITEVEENPSLDFLQSKFNSLPKGIELIVAVGGGSVIDYAKILSKVIDKDEIDIKLLTSTEPAKCIPVLALPTTAGTGAECTRFSTLWDKTNLKKLSIVSDIPSHFYIPEFTYSLPREVAINTTLDALSHCFESLWNKNANTQSKEIAVKGIYKMVESFWDYLHIPECEKSSKTRYSMLEAAGLAGRCINMTFTSIAHSISYPLTLHYKVPHGLACSFTLPILIELNKSYLSEYFTEELFMKLKLIFNELNLKKRINQYLNVKQSHALIDEMKNPSRIGTYHREVDDEDIRVLLSNSF